MKPNATGYGAACGEQGNVGLGSPAYGLRARPPVGQRDGRREVGLEETLNKSFDRPVLGGAEGLRTNGKWLISFVVSLSNHTARKRVQGFLDHTSTNLIKQLFVDKFYTLIW
jgi:hypothetical protein